MPVKKELFKLLVCSKCKGRLKKEGDFLICNKCRLKFSMINGRIPNMLIDEAETF